MCGAKSMEAYSTSKGQVVIPAELRKKYGITPGTRFFVIDDGENIILKPITPEYIRSLKGYLKGIDALAELEKDREFEKEF
jgi:AbrB family looped-hinge helix DNA binding protein